MANELKIVGYTTGQTILAHILDNSLAQVGLDISATELSTGNYAATVPDGTGAGEYTVTFTNSGEVVATGALYWDGTSEVDFYPLPETPIAREVNFTATVRIAPETTSVKMSPITHKAHLSKKMRVNHTATKKHIKTGNTLFVRGS